MKLNQKINLVLTEQQQGMNKDNNTEKGKVKFLTPVPYYSTPELRKKGLVIVDLEQLVESQRAFDSLLKDHIPDVKKKTYNNIEIDNILADFIVDLCEHSKDGHVCQPSNRIYNKTRKRVSSLLTNKIKEERAICRKIFIDNVDWSEWGVSDEEAGEDFDEARKELKTLQDE